MRRFDKNINIGKANLLAEQRYLESKGILKEMISGPTIDIEGVTDSLVNTISSEGDNETVYQQIKKTLADSNSEVKYEFYITLANKLDAKNLSKESQSYRMIANSFK